MKLITLFLAFGLFAACASKKNNTNTEITNPETTVTADTLVMIKRGGCYGRCPIDKTVIMEDGQVYYKGKKFVDNVGEFTTQISPAMVEEIKNDLADCHFFTLADRYPEDPENRISDLPTVTIYAKSGDQSHLIYNSHDAPTSLNSFQKKMSAIINEFEFTTSK